MAPVPDFDEALDAARGGEQWAVAVLYRDLHPRLLGYLRAREPRAAEDLEAETWLAIAQRITAFDGDHEAFWGWAFSIARRRLADYRRTAARRATYPTPTDELDRADHQNVEDVALDGLSSDAAAAFVVASLPPDQAEVVLLRVMAGLDTSQVAALLSKKPGTIRVLQHRALRRLAVLLETGGVTTEPPETILGAT